MNCQHYIQTFTSLGDFFKQEAHKQPDWFTQAYHQNNWFTVEYIKTAFLAWANELTPHKLEQWLANHQQFSNTPPLKVAIIMAGNIPLVGLHDLLAVLVSGNKALVKLSSDDTVLMERVIGQLIQIEPKLGQQIEVVKEQLPKGFDAVIATGSNNTNRYFDYYFKGKPALLRKSRTSVAVLTGNETPEDYQKLGSDIFTYFGLGCRNVSKLYVPKGFDIVPFYEGIEPFNQHINHHKYANNYTYHKAILLMNQTKHFDNNFLLLKEDEKLSSPLGVMFYEYYNNLEELAQTLKGQQEQIQCVVSKLDLGYSLPLGKAQQPALDDYADGVNTLDFLQSL